MQVNYYPQKIGNHTQQRDTNLLYHHDKIFMAYRLFSTIEFASKTNHVSKKLLSYCKMYIKQPLLLNYNITRSDLT